MPEQTRAAYRRTRLLRILEKMKQPPFWASALVLAEGPDGYLLLPCIGRRERKHAHAEPWWDRAYNRRNPFHWPYMLATLVTGWVVYVDD